MKRLEVLAREPNAYTSTYPSEVVTCELPDGSTVRLLCKHGDGRERSSYGHRGSVSYEAQVYRDVLQAVAVPTPKFYGTHADASTGELFIVVEYLSENVRVKDSRDILLMREAARWLGHFHRANQPLLSRSSLAFLNRHDAGYYLDWATRTSIYAGHRHKEFPWLADLCRRFEDVVETLLAPPPVIVHGEYYPNNILFSQGTIFPVDWESAAVAMGEIDLASLTEKWPARYVDAAVTEYKSTRWPEGAPAGFQRRLEAAQLYWLLRWLGDRPEWTTHEKELRRFRQLGEIGQRWGLI